MFTSEEEEEDALLLAASQQLEKRCSPLMTNEHIQSSVVAQIPANTKQSNNWAASMWQAWAIGRSVELTKEWVNLDLTSVTDADLAAWILHALHIEGMKQEW